MKAEYANIFIRSAVSVFQSEIGIRLSRESLKRKETPTPSFPISIVIGITGQIRGQVVYSLDHDFADAIAHAMVPNTLPSVRRRLINSAVGEIGNMVTGRASIALAGKNHILQLTPPAVFTGHGITVDFLELPTICLRMLSEVGILEMNIALLEGEEG
jgi:chemotaxis protein CheX